MCRRGAEDGAELTGCRWYEVELRLLPPDVWGSIEVGGITPIPSAAAQGRL